MTDIGRLPGPFRAEPDEADNYDLWVILDANNDPVTCCGKPMSKKQAEWIAGKLNAPEVDYIKIATMIHEHHVSHVECDNLYDYEQRAIKEWAEIIRRELEAGNE